MRDPLSPFWQSAKEVRLSPEERADMRDSFLLMQDARTSSQRVALSTEEKEEGKQALQAFLDLHPQQKQVMTPQLFSLRFASAAMAIIFLFSAGGGAAYAAETSVPGDLLYALKVDVTEPLREHFYWSPMRRAQWSERRLERRMEEAETLMRRGHRPPKSLEELQQRMEKHLTRMEERLNMLSSEDDAERIRTHLEERMTHHEGLLTQLQNGEIAKEDVQSFMKNMRQKRGRVKGMHRKERMEFKRGHQNKGEGKQQKEERLFP